MSKASGAKPSTNNQKDEKMVSSYDNEIANGNSTSSKLSKIGRRIRDSYRQHVRGKHPSGGASSNPDDYGTTPVPNESSRSLHYVPMDFTGGKSGRIVTAKDMPGQTTKDGYTFFRRPIEPTDVDHLLTETQANIHKNQAWFHKGVGRDLAQRILGSHSVDGCFLVRESSVQGGFVISYYFNGRAYHAPVMPFTHPTSNNVTYSLDDGKTKFYDLLQLVEFYQLNKGTLCAKLSHFVIAQPRSSSPVSSKHASDVSLDSKNQVANSCVTDDNHNSKKSGQKQQNMETSSSDGDEVNKSEDDEDRQFD